MPAYRPFPGLWSWPVRRAQWPSHRLTPDPASRGSARRAGRTGHGVLCSRQCGCRLRRYGSPVVRKIIHPCCWWCIVRRWVGGCASRQSRGLQTRICGGLACKYGRRRFGREIRGQCRSLLVGEGVLRKAGWCI